MNLPSTIADPSGPTPPPSSAYASLHHPHGQQGAPSTSSTSNPSGAQAPSNSQVLLATENFITFLDALKLGMASKDALHPLLAELIQSVNAVTDRDFEGRGKIIAWLIRLNGMKAQEEVEEGGRREMAFEIEGAYRGFKGVLS